MLISTPTLRRVLILPLLAALSLLGACADTPGGSIPYDRPLAAPDELTFQTLESDYKIAPMDKLSDQGLQDGGPVRRL